MQLSNLLLAGAFAALTAAAPSIAHRDVQVSERACHPDRPVQGQSSCTTKFPTGTSRIHLVKNRNVDIQQTLSFTIPANARGPCSLIATFPAGYHISSTGNAQVNVYDVNGPAAGSLVGTITFASDPYNPKVNTINSFACRPNMKYRLALAGTQGSVDFANGNGAGVAMTYNC
jgi:hypothetical protein